MSGGPVRVFAVVSVQSKHAVEIFVRREQAEHFLEDFRADEPELAERLRIEPVELDRVSSRGVMRGAVRDDCLCSSRERRAASHAWHVHRKRNPVSS
jgi:hypothetical protein